MSSIGGIGGAGSVSAAIVQAQLELDQAADSGANIDDLALNETDQTDTDNKVDSLGAAQLQQEAITYSTDDMGGDNSDFIAGAGGLDKSTDAMLDQAAVLTDAVPAATDFIANTNTDTDTDRDVGVSVVNTLEPAADAAQLAEKTQNAVMEQVDAYITGQENTAAQLATELAQVRLASEATKA